MEKQVRFFKVELTKTWNWKQGVLKDNVPKDTKKHLCIVTFTDEQHNQYSWTPEVWEVNIILSIAKYMILADKKNVSFIKNPEPRPDIVDLTTILSDVVPREALGSE